MVYESTPHAISMVSEKLIDRIPMIIEEFDTATFPAVLVYGSSEEFKVFAGNQANGNFIQNGDCVKQIYSVEIRRVGISFKMVIV